MSRVITAAAIAASFAARYPQSTTLASLAASGSGEIDSVQAQAVRGFSTPTGKLQWVRATEHFFEAGELIMAGDYVEMREADAAGVIYRGFAEIATAEQAAQAAAASTKKA